MEEINKDDLGSLRPIERRILKLRTGMLDGEEHSAEELAEKFHRSPDQIERIGQMAAWKLEHKGEAGATGDHDAGDVTELRPIERRILKLRTGELDGEQHSAEELAEKFHRSPDQIERIGQMAAWKLEFRRRAAGEAARAADAASEETPRHLKP